MTRGYPFEVFFWCAAFGIFYTYVGYPFLLAVLAWLRPAPRVRGLFQTPPVTLLMVVHNEEAQIESKLRNLLRIDYPPERLDILVVSDGSTDGTDEIAGAFAPERVRLLSAPGPEGKAAAIGRALPHCRGELIVLCDVRQELAEDAVACLVRALADPTVGAVSGELHFLPPAGAAGVAAYWDYEKVIRRLESRFDSTVGVTGALYAIRKELLHPPDPRTILDDVAIPMDVVRAGRRVIFEPSARVYDEPGEADREYRRKVRTLAGNYQLVALRPELLDPRRNRLIWQFASHKLCRLLVPWLLLALLAASSVLESRGGVYRAAFLVQLISYAAALLGGLLGRLRVRPNPLSLPYWFVFLNVAAAASLFVFLSGTQKAAWKARA